MASETEEAKSSDPPNPLHPFQKALVDKPTASNLLLVNLKSVTVLHLESVGGIVWLDSLALEKEAHGVDGLALALAERAHQLLQLGGLLYLKEDLVVVVRHLNVEVLRLGGCLLTLRRWGPVLVLFAGHGCGG